MSTHPTTAATTRFIDDPFSLGGPDCPLIYSALASSLQTSVSARTAALSPDGGEGYEDADASPTRHLGIDDLFRLRPEDHALLHGLHDQVQGDPERGEQDEHGEDPGDVQGKVELENEVAEPALGAHELAHDGPEHAEHDGDVEPREHEGERVGERHEPKRLPAAGPQGAHEVELGRVDGLEPHDHVDEHGKEGHGRRDDDLGRDAEAEPHDDERRDGDLGQRLEGDQVGIERLLHHAELRDEGAQDDSRRRRDAEAQERLVQRHPEVRQVEPALHAAHEGAPYGAGRGNEEGGDAPGPDHPFPGRQERHEDEGNEDEVGTASHEGPGRLAQLRPRRARRRRRPAHGIPRERAQSSHPLASKRCRIRRVYTPNSSEAIMSRSRGRDSRTSTISWIRPGRADITTTRSARKAASGIEWVMNTMVLPDSCQIRRSSRFMNSRVMASSAPKGSSMRRSEGSCTRARAMATRCRMPPGRPVGYLSSNPSRPTRPRRSMARLPELLRSSPSTSTGSITLSKTVRQGRSTGSWNTMPMSRLGPSTSRPRRVTLPAERGSRPARILSRVVFPHPDCPTMVMNSPAPTSTEIPARACTCARPRVAYVFSRLDTTISGAVTAFRTLAGRGRHAQLQTMSEQA